MKHIPFSIFAAAPLPGVEIDPKDPRSIGPLDRVNLDANLAALGCAVDVALPRSVCPAGETRVRIRSLTDLTVEGLLRASTYLSDLSGALELVRAHRGDVEATADGLMARFGHLPLDLRSLQSAPPPTDASGESVLDALFSKIALPDEGGDERPFALEDQIEKLMSDCIATILDDDGFRELEATLRGIALLVEQGGLDRDAGVSLTLYPTGEDNLEAILRAIVRQSGVHPPSLMLVDRSFGNTFADVDTLETLANFSSAVNAPTVVGLSPRFFGLDGWAGFSELGYLGTVLGEQAFAKFRALRDAPTATWLTLTTPGMMLGRAGVTAHPVWAVGALAAQSQHTFGWPTRLLDVAVTLSESPASDSGFRPSLPYTFSSDRVTQLAEIGVAPLMKASADAGVTLGRDVTAGGGTLAEQLFANRMLAFLYLERERLSGSDDSIAAAELGAHLERRLLEAWQVSGQAAPSELNIEVHPSDRPGEMALSLRITPSTTICSLPKPLMLTLFF